MKLFSIITPCYNSTSTLWSTYQSLLAQNESNFEWILVDDASNDNGKTKEMICQILNSAPFTVKFKFLKENYFASRSAFTGCLLAEGKYVAVLDHDDQLSPDSLCIVKNNIDKHCNSEKIAGICGRCIDEKGDLIGRKFRKDHFIATEGQVRFNEGITSELFHFSKIEIVKPLFQNMKPGYTNGFVWANVSRNYKYLYINDVLRIYNTDIPTSYTNTKGMATRYPAAKAEALSKTISIYRPYMKNNIKYSSRMVGSYLRHTFNNNFSLFVAIRDFDIFLKLLCLVMYPIAILKAKGFLR